MYVNSAMLSSYFITARAVPHMQNMASAGQQITWQTLSLVVCMSRPLSDWLTSASLISGLQDGCLVYLAKIRKVAYKLLLAIPDWLLNNY